jgi:hypothetical protein
MRNLIGFGAIVTLSLAASTAFAQDAEQPEEGAAPAAKPSHAEDAEQPEAAAAKPSSDLPAPGEEDRSYSHFFQFGIRVGLAIGYRMVFRYDSSPWCNKEQVIPGSADFKGENDRQKFCGFGGPLAFDVALSFAPLGPIEPYVWGRFGLSGEGNTNTEPVRILGVGARVYTSSESAFKVFIEPAVAYEFEGGAGNPYYARFDYKKDMVVHLGVGPQIDVSRGVGFYLDGGLTVGMLRAIHTNLELQLGAQARFP